MHPGCDRLDAGRSRCHSDYASAAHARSAVLLAARGTTPHLHATRQAVAAPTTSLLPHCQLQRTWSNIRVDVWQQRVRRRAHAAQHCWVWREWWPAWPGQGPCCAWHARWHGHGHAHCTWGWHGHGPCGQRGACRAWRAQGQRAVGPHLCDGHVEQLLQRGHDVALCGRVAQQRSVSVMAACTGMRTWLMVH
jgi:hypothetical protein